MPQSFLELVEEEHLDEGTGCFFYRDCLTCPFTECIFDVSMERQLVYALKYRLNELFNTGQYPNALYLAEKLGISYPLVQAALVEQDKLAEYKRFEQTAKVFE